MLRALTHTAGYEFRLGTVVHKRDFYELGDDAEAMVQYCESERPGFQVQVKQPLKDPHAVDNRDWASLLGHSGPEA